MPPARASIALSVISCRTSRARLAPIAARTAISCFPHQITRSEFRQGSLHPRAAPAPRPEHERRHVALFGSDQAEAQ